MGNGATGAGAGNAGSGWAGPAPAPGNACWRSGSACVPMFFATFNAEVAWGIKEVAVFTIGATMEMALGIKEIKPGKASAPIGSPKPLYMMRAGTTSDPA
jgi:hypothetical protein